MGVVVMSDSRREMLQLLSMGAMGLAGMSAGLVAADSRGTGAVRSSGKIGRGAASVDFADPAQKLDAFIKVEGDTSGEEHFLYGYGTIYAYIDGMPDRKLMDTELYAVRRYRRVDGGWIRLHREAGIYRDPETKKILTRWRNPWLERDIEPINIYQEFNRRYLAADLGRTFNIGVAVQGDDVFMQRSFFIVRPSEYQPAEYPLHGQDHFYNLSEFINFFAKASDIVDPRLSAAPAVGVTNSVTGWFPWMEMGNAPGQLVHQIRFKKLSKVAEMPSDFVEIVRRHDPKFLTAPTEFSAPDLATSGERFYKSVIDQRIRDAGSNAGP
jgi:hypothetical protein